MGTSAIIRTIPPYKAQATEVIIDPALVERATIQRTPNKRFVEAVELAAAAEAAEAEAALELREQKIQERHDARAAAEDRPAENWRRAAALRAWETMRAKKQGLQVAVAS